MLRRALATVSCCSLLVLIAAQDAANSKPLECGYRKLAFEDAQNKLPLTAAQKLDIFEALELGTLCGEGPPDVASTASAAAVPSARAIDMARSVVVDPSMRGGVAAALRKLRASGGKKDTIVLKDGVHFLNETLTLGPADSGTTITAAPGAEAWLSGGAPLGKLEWSAAEHPSGSGGVWAASLKGTGVDKVPGLFTTATHERFVRSRFPNANPEHACWGYSCPDKDTWSLNSDQVAEWIKPPPGPPPTPTTYDFSVLPNAADVVKNDSAQGPYNTWTAGDGDLCATVWKGQSYWCSNASSGGWAEVDFHDSINGQLGLPVGMRVNFTEKDEHNIGPNTRHCKDGAGHCNLRHDLSRIKTWANPEGAVVAAWHSQTWFLNFFTVSSSDPEEGTISFSKGGSQGGRNWCRCDECAYAAGIWAGHQWCGASTEFGEKDDRLIGGAWMVENVFEELDNGGEYFYNESTQMLYVMPNTTDPSSAPPPDDLVVPILQQLIATTGTQEEPVRDISISGVNFRDAVAVYEEQWEVPSGGDWALHRSGAIFLEGTTNAKVSGGLFKRLDGNAILLNGFNRGAVIEKNEFVYIADNVLAGWGKTKEWDGRNGDQPRGTVVQENIIHELGFFEKQSSAWFQALTATTTIKNNIMYNMPRAAINFNDGFGGGNIVEGNLIWNTCRESGDHGPINSWDRQAFFTDIPSPPSFDPTPTQITSNFIFANYGAAQGVDNDDGSSFYDISENIFFDADGFKMDYGGHGSKFYNNLVITKPENGACIGNGPYDPGLGDAYYNNTCVLPGMSGAAGMVGHVAQCEETQNDMHDNKYYTTPGNATLGSCGLVTDMYAKNGNEKDSTSSTLPSDEEMVKWARERLQLL